jgi:hypothetical protein
LLYNFEKELYDFGGRRPMLDVRCVMLDMHGVLTMRELPGLIIFYWLSSIYYSFLQKAVNRILAESQKDFSTGQRPVIKEMVNNAP